jgi:hypothetical protein
MTCPGISTLATWIGTPTASEMRRRLLIRPKSGQTSQTATLAQRTQGDELGLHGRARRDSNPQPSDP